MSDDMNQDDREPVDPHNEAFELLRRKIRETQATMTTPELAIAALVRHQDFAIQRAHEAAAEKRDPVAIQRVIDAVARSQRVASNAACGDGHIPPVPAFRLEVADLMSNVALLHFAPREGSA